MNYPPHSRSRTSRPWWATHSPWGSRDPLPGFYHPFSSAMSLSAPGSFITSITDSIVTVGGSVGSDAAAMSLYFSGDSPCLTAESNCKSSIDLGQQRPYGGASDDFSAADLASSDHERASLGGGDGAPAKPNLLRQHSSPAGYFTNLLGEIGYSGAAARVVGSYSNGPGASDVHGRLHTQLSFTAQESLFRISEFNGINDVGETSSASGRSSEELAGSYGQSYISSTSDACAVGSWDKTNTIEFSNPSSTSKRAKYNDADVAVTDHRVASHFSLPKMSLDMAAVEKLLHEQKDYTPLKVRAKRGCATHPRSIAERDRRTRISEKLRKLQNLMPNIEKQTNIADMLDLAVDHIKVLQGQIQRLKEERERCKCNSKRAML